MAAAPSRIALRRSRSGRSDDFERWLRDVALPASRSDGMDDERFALLRADDADLFVFTFVGGDAEERDLSAPLARALGPERSAEETDAFLAVLDGDPDLWPVSRPSARHARCAGAADRCGRCGGRRRPRHPQT